MAIRCVRTSPLFCVATRLTSRIGRSKQSRSHSIERRIFSTMRFLQRATTTSRNPSSILLERLPGILIFTLLSLLLLLLQKFRLTWLHNNCMKKN
ncbi:hypothetical protein RHGRI_035235 [Rhododendron griersonianum]|uniref:Uncharacterized protein n=1 Tax=Rhododendron griersonianum TaxID=479676 RepID=A0AAV6I7M4_9ERIC|nr:hypothetical protein RHGRI_035235 [Rhododendron griersonianum]